MTIAMLLQNTLQAMKQAAPDQAHATTPSW
jgi:5,10-methylene-tetrahydrofolate dehydrogenase/methenyl tetrahydrofolate cyclohydrolase